MSLQQPAIPRSHLELSTYLFNKVLTLTTDGSKELLQYMPSRIPFKSDQMQLLITILDPKITQDIYPDTLSTPDMKLIIDSILTDHGEGGQRFLSIACTESRNNILEEMRVILKKIEDENGDLGKRRMALNRKREKLVTLRNFYGRELQAWEEVERELNEDKDRFVAGEVELRRKLEELGEVEKHLRRAETLTRKFLGEA